MVVYMLHISYVYVLILRNLSENQQKTQILLSYDDTDENGALLFGVLTHHTARGH